MFDMIPWKRKNEIEGGLATRKPFQNPFASLHDDFNTLAQKMMGDWSGISSGLPASNWRWGLDVDETDKEFIVIAEAPGFEVDDFDVQVSDRQLVIRAEQNHEEKSKNGSTMSKRSYHRRITLPPGAMVENVEANYKNGILELHLPKGEDCKTKRITVQSK